VFNHWVTILLTIAAVGGAIATIIGWFRAPIRWWLSRKKKALSFAQNDLFCFWSVGKLSDQSEPVTLVSGRWRLTNSSDRDVKITNVRLSKYVHQSARLAMRNPEDERNIFVYGNFPIATHQTLEVEVILTFVPVVTTPMTDAAFASAATTCSRPAGWRKIPGAGRWPSTAAACDGSATSAVSDCVTTSHALDDKVLPASSARCRARRCGPSC
jgi:hypothetical protein